MGKLPTGSYLQVPKVSGTSIPTGTKGTRTFGKVGTNLPIGTKGARTCNEVGTLRYRRLYCDLDINTSIRM